MPQQRHPVSIALSAAQVDEVVRAAARERAPSISALIADRLGLRAGPGHLEPCPDPGDSGDGLTGKAAERRCSQSLLRGLSLLSSFDREGSERGIVELAGELDMSPSTAHRYALTLVELGLLERCPRTRKYRLPPRSS